MLYRKEKWGRITSGSVINVVVGHDIVSLSLCSCVGIVMAPCTQPLSKICFSSSSRRYGFMRRGVSVCSPRAFNSGKVLVGLATHPRSSCRRCQGRRKKVISSQFGFGATQDATTSLIVFLGQLASASAWMAVAYLGYKLALQQEQPSSGPECETCGGTGLVDCFCTRWNDGDRSGCGACHGTMKIACHSCRGGGTAVPIKAKVYISDERDYRL